MATLPKRIPRPGRLARHAGADATLIRYEELVRDPIRTRRALSDFLGLDLLNGASPDATAIPDNHRTSRDPAASIGRWREELTTAQIGACGLIFGPYMREVGSEPSGEGGLVRRRPSAPLARG